MTFSEFSLIAGMAIATFLIRYSLIAMSGRIQLSEGFMKLLRYVPPAVLTAIVVPAVLIPTGDTLDLSYGNARLIGAIAAIIVGWKTKNLLLVIVIGMIIFLLWQWLVG
jgi:branched-subunit amino acid transport protein